MKMRNFIDNFAIFLWINLQIKKKLRVKETWAIANFMQKKTFRIAT